MELEVLVELLCSLYCSGVGSNDADLVLFLDFFEEEVDADEAGFVVLEDAARSDSSRDCHCMQINGDNLADTHELKNLGDIVGRLGDLLVLSTSLLSSIAVVWHDAGDTGATSAPAG